MKVFFDTSVLVAAMVQSHPMHSRALPWLKRAKEKKFEFFISSHTMAELYAVLTTIPLSPRISPGTAWRLIHENVEKLAKIESLSSSEYSVVIKQMSERGLTGSIIYDALIARSAQKAKVERLLTLNLDDFKLVWTGEQSVLCIP